MELEGKVALIFAATGDIASEVARAFAAHGATVYLSARDEEATKKVAKDINLRGGRSFAQKVDALNELEIREYVRAVYRDTGRIDIVFNGIGIRPVDGAYGTPFMALPLEKFLLPIEQHVVSQFLTAKAAAEFMVHAKQGVILTLSASIGKEARPLMIGISSACAAIEGMTRVMAAELGEAGVRVLCVRGGAMFETRTIKETIAANARTIGIPEEVFGGLIQQQALMKRAPRVQEVAETLAFLASDRASAMTGQIINVTAGLVLH